jgi:predicted MFS family arabinose efflux permease
VSPANRHVVITALGLMQILAWGSTFYLLAVLAKPIVADTGWSYERVMLGLSVGLLAAGLVSPRVGRAIHQWGGRPVLAAGTLFIAAGLALVGASEGYAWYLAGWGVVGIGMGAGLYDAAFSTLGHIYGQQARSPVTLVTLFGGFASTVCWPISAYLVAHFGWRTACLAYAGVHLGLALPLYLAALPRRAKDANDTASTKDSRPIRLAPEQLPVFLVLGAVVTLSAAILSMMGALILTLLQARGLDLPTAVLFGTIIGPAAVSARFIEMLGARHYHPIWTLVASVVLVAIGMSMLWAGSWLLALAIGFYAAGNGISSVARATVPLALWGQDRYPVVMGRLGFPILLAMAAAPMLGAAAFQLYGATGAFAVLNALAFCNVVMVAALFTLIRVRPRSTMDS